MTITLFISVLTLGAGVTALLTEAIKKAYENAGKEYSSNIIALIDAIVVGGGGVAVTYMLMDIPWTVNNIICLVLMTIAVWIGSMIGFDKVIQLIKQLEKVKESKNSTNDNH